MSPSPDLSPQKISSAESTPPESVASEFTQAETPPNSNLDADADAAETSKEEAPVLRKPPMRPVRPQPPTQATVAKSGELSSKSGDKPPIAAKPASPKLEIVSVSSSSSVSSPAPTPTEPLSSEPSEEEQANQTGLRQQPIPPPSEPKQYRAIGLVRGIYTPVEEEFTRGDFKASDGSDLKAVLLGRVMSLVKNHIDLEKEHIWVVYPRTREEEKELHLQIVGVWEPETLKKDESDGENGAIEDSTSGLADLQLEVDYFSVRGEIVFVAPEENLIVVKIQQTPRKNSQKAKAFKLSLRGELDNTRTVGYFWDLHIKREDNLLLVTGGTCIGMAPPKKRDKDFVKKGPRKPSFGRPGGRSPVGRSTPAGAPRPPREPASKPIKRSEQNTTSED